MDPHSIVESPSTSESAASWLRSAARAFGISDARSQSWIAARSVVDRRYHVVRPLGAGGMAVVLLAWDLELDRPVALKVYDHDVNDAARSRTHAEARAMAALAHPNVAAIYDIGVHGARLYIAMEFVDGGTLGAWLRRERRSQTEVVAVFEACARGLAAAHAAGIVHGDVKPSNLLVDADGRPRVADFGLARLARGTNAGEASTREPTFFGTPRYAAPEQHGRNVVDARADQFALCVSLYEALFDEHPFVGDDTDSLVASIRCGRRRARAFGVRTNRRLVRALDRGLACDPGERFASMDELVAALRDGSRRRRVWLGLGAAACGALAYALWPRPDGCDDRDAGVERVWNEDRQLAITRAFAASDSAFQAEALGATMAALEDWSARWRSDRHDACLAMRTSTGDDADRLDRRVRCLDRQLDTIAAVTDALGRADRETIQRVPDVVVSLPSPLQCDDLDEDARERLADPELAADVESERQRLARGRVALELGRHAEASELAGAVVRGRAAAQWPALHGEASLLLGRAQRHAGELRSADLALTDAYHDAIAAGDDATAATAATELVCVLPNLRGGVARAASWLRLAEAMNRRSADARNEARLGLCRGDLSLAEGRHLEAERAYRDALGEATALDADPLVVARLHAGIGNALFERGQLRESLLAHDEAYRIVVAAGAQRHPDGIVIATARGDLLTRAKRPSDGLAAQLACLESAIVALGGDALMVPRIYNNIARAMLGLGSPPLAARYAQRGIELARARTDAANELPWLLSRMADANDQMGHSDRALRYATEAIAAADESFGPDHPVTATMIVNHGVQLLGLYRDDEAAVELARGLELLRSEYGDTYPKIGIICLNFVQLFQRREQAAVADVYLAWAERVAAANDDARLHMSVLMWRGLSLMLAGELERSLPLLERAAELAHAIDPHVEQKLRRDIGYVQLDLGRPAAAMESLLESHALAAAADNLGEVSVTKLAMAHASRALGRRAEGRRLAMEALHVAEVADDEADAAEARAWLAKQGVRVPARRPGEK